MTKSSCNSISDSELAFLPDGEVAQSTGGMPAFGFVGARRRITNPLTGLIHMGAQMYEPTLGSFLSRDPILGGSANDYEYTSGDPVNRLDLSGMCATSSTSRCGMPRCCGDPGFVGPCSMPSPVTIGSLNTFDVPGPFKVVGTSGNQVFIIDTRTGELITVDLGSAAASRQLTARNTVSYSEVGWRAVEAIPFYGVYVSARDCPSGWKCAIINTGGAALSILSLFPGGGATWAAMVVMPGVDYFGQISGGASAW